MGLAAAGLIPTLDVALEALALALAGNVYLIAVGEYVSLNDLTDFVSRGIIQLEFAYIAVSGNAGLLQVTSSGFVMSFSLTGPKATCTAS